GRGGSAEDEAAVRLLTTAKGQDSKKRGALVGCRITARAPQGRSVNLNFLVSWLQRGPSGSTSNQRRKPAMLEEFSLRTSCGGRRSSSGNHPPAILRVEELEARVAPGTITRWVETGKGVDFDTYCGYTVANQQTTLVNSVQVNANAIGLRYYASVY